MSKSLPVLVGAGALLVTAQLPATAQPSAPPRCTKPIPVTLTAGEGAVKANVYRAENCSHGRWRVTGWIEDRAVRNGKGVSFGLALMHGGDVVLASTPDRAGRITFDASDPTAGPAEYAYACLYTGGPKPPCTAL